MGTLRIAGAALNQIAIDWEGNRARIIEAIEQAREKRVDILCLPELCVTGYGCEDLFLSEWLYDAALESTLKIIPYCKDITVAVSLPVRHNTRHYNTTMVVEDGVPLAIYAKHNMASDGVHYEPRWFSPWTAYKEETFQCGDWSIPIGDITVHSRGAHIGFEICEDAWRTGDERPACRLVEKGVNVIMNPSASHFAFGKTLLREELVVDSSRDFRCTYVYANLLGNEAGRMIYDGEMMIAHHGKLVARNEWLSFESVQLLIADVDVNDPTATYPEPPQYDRSKETEFMKAGTLALFDYMRKSHSQGFVLSLSGGADSSTIAVLVRHMVRRGIEELGLEKFLKKSGLKLPETASEADICRYILTTAYQGTKNSSEATRASARQLAGELGSTHYEWNIDEEVASSTAKIEHAIGRKLTWEQDDITLQNIQARVRSPLIWMLANINRALLLTTSNRSEGDVGYTTMDGDTSGGLAPIAAVDKHFIVGWLKWAEETLVYSSLSYVNSLAPSAELRPLDKSQTDEDDLMPYAIMVQIERLAIAEHRSPMEVYHGLKDRNIADDARLKLYITRFYRLWSQNQWKRERIAPAFHLDDFNVDPRTWCRFPILSAGYAEELKKLNQA